MKTIIRICFLVFFLPSIHAQTFNTQLASRLQDTLDTYVSMITNIKGMSAAVSLPGHGTWKGSSGVSFAGNPISPDMSFGIASNSKLFVSVIMLKLAENNIITLDDSVGQWLPVFPNVSSSITIRQLLNHTSGISDPIFIPPYSDTIAANPNRIFTPVEVLSWLGAPVYAPGTGWNYSNVNYILAGMIAESATGVHISRLIRDSILDPLNLDSSFYDVFENESGILAHRWYNQVDYNDTSRTGLNTAGGCAGAIFSTAGEMTAWYSALFNGQLLNAASLEELTTFVPTQVSYTYGLGLEYQTYFGHPTFGHGGSTWGYKSRMVYDPCMGSIVCGLSNSWPAGMDGVTLLLYKTLVMLLPECASGIAGPDTVCQGETQITYTIPVISGATTYEWNLPSGFTGSSATNTISLDVDTNALSGTISVRGVNSYGEGGTASMFVTVLQHPPTPLINQTGNLLTSSSNSGNQWYNSSGPISGATDSTYTVLSDDVYYLIVTMNGCSSEPSESVNVFQISVTTVEESPLTFYPNPAKDFLTIRLNTKNAEIIICDITGHVIYKSFNEALEAVIPVRSLAEGMYFIRVIENQQERQGRFYK